MSVALVIVLAAVYLLYNYYDGTLKERIAAQKGELTRMRGTVKALQSNLASAGDVEKQLRAEISDRASRHAMALKALQRMLDSSDSAKRALQIELKDANAKSAEALSAAHQQAARALADLQKKYDEAAAQVTDLSAKVEELKQAQAESDREHESQLAEVASRHQTEVAEAAARERARADEVVKQYEAQVEQERQQLTKRVELYRTALEGKEPERSAQLSSLQEQAQQEHVAREAAEQAKKDLSAAKDGLAQRLADATQALEEKTKGLKQAQNELAAAKTRLSEANTALQALRAQYQAATEKSAADLSALQEQLRAATKTHAGEMSAANTKIASLTKDLESAQHALAALQEKQKATTAALQTALDASERARADVKAKLSASTESAEQEKRELQGQITIAKARIGELEDTLAGVRQQAEADRRAVRKASGATEARLRDLYAQLIALGGRQTEHGILLTLAESELTFAPSQAALSPGGVPSLQRIAELLIKHPELNARIEGHTDNAGRAETNLELSKKRAEAVAQALEALGVAADRMAADGYGEHRPIADNGTVEGRRHNRRVEIYVVETARAQEPVLTPVKASATVD